MQQPAQLSFDRPDDATLARRVRCGDYEAFAVVFRTHYADLVRFARGLTGQLESAEEIVQDVFIRLWDRRVEWELRGTVRAYLFGATRNGALNALRQERTIRRWEDASALEPRAVAMGSGPRRPEDALAAQELDVAVARAVAQLPERTRVVYALRWRHELSYPEIAEVLGISIKTVESHMTKALAVLRTALANYR